MFGERREGSSSTNLDSTLPVSVVSHCPDLSIFKGKQMVILIKDLLQPVTICELPFKGYTSLTFPSFTPVTYFPENSLIMGY